MTYSDEGRPGPRSLLSQIDALNPAKRERDRLRILASDVYVNFVSDAFGCSENSVRRYLLELHDDVEFFNEFLPTIEKLSKLKSAGDLRFHSVTCYLAARCIDGKQAIFETGVASGKSTAYFLLGIRHSDPTGASTRKLVSFDLPPDGSTSRDGSDTGLEGRAVGWLVPERLRDNWSLLLGPAAELLPDAFTSFGSPALFLHDSLHTRDNTFLELSLALAANPQVVLLCDNLEMGSGAAFREISKIHNLQTSIFGNFGVARSKSGASIP